MAFSSVSLRAAKVSSAVAQPLQAVSLRLPARIFQRRPTRERLDLCHRCEVPAAQFQPLAVFDLGHPLLAGPA
jgi:hypothetical protein